MEAIIMAARSFRSRAGSGRTPDALTLLKQDHREVSDLFEEFESASGARKERIANQICEALTVHAQIEEEIFYPAARQVVDEEDVVDEADVEHATIKGLVGRIEQVGSSDEHYDALVKVLGEYVKHHVKEEEQSLFPKLRGTELDLNVLGEQLAARKGELAGSAAA
jgi:hemerythrin superfamily protein